MLSYELDDEHEQLRETVERFARDVVAPVIGDLYERGEFPYEIVAQMGKIGLSACRSPRSTAGWAATIRAVLALEELARVDSSVAITLEAGVWLGVVPIYRYGTEEQKREWLPRMCAGRDARRVRPDGAGRRLGRRACGPGPACRVASG